jgi:AcrR family transcriptional regulator
MTAKAEKPGRQPARGELLVEGPRRRRARGEPRRLLLEAATDLFNERGYSASTRDIADRANVSETLMFRYFGSKAGLFHEAMVKPFSEFVASFAAEHGDGLQEGEDSFAVSLEFIGQLYDLFRSHRGLVSTLWSTATYDGSDLSDAGFEEEMWQNLDLLVQIGRRSPGRPARNEISTRAIVSMVAGMAVSDRAFESGKVPSRDIVVYELAKIATFGRAIVSGPGEVDIPKLKD